MSILLDSRLPHRFWRHITFSPSGCWIWNGKLSDSGYGAYRISWRPPSRWTFTHRIAYTTLVGPIADGLEIDHLCKVRACCNPAHLEAVTRRVNWERATSPTRINALKTHCIHGHELSGANLVPRYLKQGARVCLECRRRDNRARMKRRAAKQRLARQEGSYA